ncbi:hypothetical protein [Leekyejoonella antrihumi]|uniref:Uncharacterized protein n=1 Tax=Leekyejoonella antrihumi TaxID=1660198 RepID=A0A563DXL5_9MICO|nr:hypothetical protein [Leekyejoonella antrihumi]TWP34967.1 hypothetical protein FGL98_15610 [Leekyejoonella antrihumi]
MSDASGRSGNAHEERAASPLGDVQRASSRVRRGHSLALQEAAGNLLEKAYQRLQDHDDERAEEYVRRAAAIPWDEQEGSHPAVMDVHLVLFDEVAEAMQDSTQQDLRWLLAAREAIDHLDERPALELARALASLDQDYPVSRLEHRVLREIVGSRATADYDLTYGLTAASSTDEVVATIEPMLHALVAYSHAFHHAD